MMVCPKQIQAFQIGTVKCKLVGDSLTSDLPIVYNDWTPALIQKLEAWGPCWNVSVLAQAAGLACCQVPDWPAGGRRLLEEQRPRLEQGRTRLGCQVIPGSANYLLFRGPAGLDTALLRQKIAIRSCANYTGLGEGWYRTAVRLPEENEALLDALRRGMEELSWR